jgi:putative endonuclease
MSYHFYILKSQNFDRYYLGQTSNLKSRLQRHNRGEMFSTKPYLPWDLIYYETFRTRGQAMARERFLKSPQGWKELQEIKSKFSKP